MLFSQLKKISHKEVVSCFLMAVSDFAYKLSWHTGLTAVKIMYQRVHDKSGKGIIYTHFFDFCRIMWYNVRVILNIDGGDRMSVKGAAKERTESRLKEPKQYNVIMINDDFTTMEFVVEILVEVFHKDELTAQALMMNVHKNGQAVVGKYPYDIAATKVRIALDRAKEQGFPFRMTVEEA